MSFLPLPAEHLTLKELVQHTGQFLAQMRVTQKDGRATARPDVRAVRYYVSLGIVDRPSGFRGNTALYSERHILQLLSAKVLQAQGLRLPEIQARLLGLEDADLARLLPPIHQPLPEPRMPSLPAGTELRLDVHIQQGLSVSIDPWLLQNTDRIALLAEAVGTALDRAARALANAPLLTPVPPEEDR
ncbi:MAG: MerR family transcriptional regulator [Deltaproteobacteria bacterium]|nr:MerR family transcriptional regulator [Deltaproteobacteria bacterium]